LKPVFIPPIPPKHNYGEKEASAHENRMRLPLVFKKDV
jgi:hypothetical protein